MSCNWEGNRRSGIALAVRDKLHWSIHLLAQHSCQGSLNHNDILTTHTTLRTPDVEIGTVRVGDTQAVLSNALVFAFVRFLAASYLQ